MIIDISETALRFAATKVRSARPGVEPSVALAVIQALVVMGWRPPPVPGVPDSDRQVLDGIGDLERRLRGAVDACTDLSKDYAALIIAKDRLERRLAARTQDLRRAVAVVQYAHHLRVHGERAPGGNETWEQFDRASEECLRAMLSLGEIEEAAGADRP